MGRNVAIKRYRPILGARTLDLFEPVEERRLVVLDLLGTTWIFRASELDYPGDAGVGRRVREAIFVNWEVNERRPVTFVRGRRTYHVDSIVQSWAVEYAWWDPVQHISRRCWRVLTREGGPYDLAFDRLNGRWLLLGIQD